MKRTREASRPRHARVPRLHITDLIKDVVTEEIAAKHLDPLSRVFLGRTCRLFRTWLSPRFLNAETIISTASLRFATQVLRRAYGPLIHACMSLAKPLARAFAKNPNHQSLATVMEFKKICSNWDLDEVLLTTLVKKQRDELVMEWRNQNPKRVTRLVDRVWTSEWFEVLAKRSDFIDVFTQATLLPEVTERLRHEPVWVFATQLTEKLVRQLLNLVQKDAKVRQNSRDYLCLPGRAAPWTLWNYIAYYKICELVEIRPLVDLEDDNEMPGYLLKRIIGDLEVEELIKYLEWCPASTIGYAVVAKGLRKVKLAECDDQNAFRNMWAILANAQRIQVEHLAIHDVAKLLRHLSRTPGLIEFLKQWFMGREPLAHSRIFVQLCDWFLLWPDKRPGLDQ